MLGLRDAGLGLGLPDYWPALVELAEDFDKACGRSLREVLGREEGGEASRGEEGDDRGGKKERGRVVRVEPGREEGLEKGERLVVRQATG